MKLKKSYEQAICVLLMLALSKDSEPVKSELISKRLGVSDSYLKKVLRQLVVEKLIQSQTGKSGGFVLRKSIEDITMLDVYEAMEGRESLIQYSRLAERVFLHVDYVTKKEEELVSIVSEAEQSFLNTLRKVCLSSLLMDDRGQYIDGIDWNVVRN